MSKLQYSEYLKSPHWLEVRARILKRDNYRCVACPASQQLHVHHMTYQHLGMEKEYELITLCADCHKILHKRAYRKDLFIYSVRFVRTQTNKPLLEENVRLWLEENGKCYFNNYPKKLKGQLIHMSRKKTEPKKKLKCKKSKTKERLESRAKRMTHIAHPVSVKQKTSREVLLGI